MDHIQVPTSIKSIWQQARDLQMAYELHKFSHALWEICPLGVKMSHCSNFRTFFLSLHEVTET